MDRQTRNGDTVLVKSREMTAVVGGGKRVKTTEKQNTLAPFWCCLCLKQWRRSLPAWSPAVSRIGWPLRARSSGTSGQSYVMGSGNAHLKKIWIRNHAKQVNTDLEWVRPRHTSKFNSQPNLRRKSFFENLVSSIHWNNDIYLNFIYLTKFFVY